ncbi:DNA mismatch repair protein Msh5 [Aspergillus bombycis]|uniref:DNA mismatch repair protein MSH5 n=1 Tax=Aspergillus bombycis TaxID=109264 RepID=A0A1F7ZYV7_9EURO|nr:DNA mismatch repair protein Msh5 [Aspergillus bombycis]OGM44275.1 DNA mismatch repair protein Msh5 [Aspergillus bombycis]
MRQQLFNDSRGYLSGGPIQQLTDDDLDQVIVAIDMRESGTVGCSYYSAQEETLYLLGDMQSASTEILDSLVIQTKPTALLLSPRVDHLWSQNIDEYEQGNSSQFYLPYQLDVRPSQEFSYLNAKNKLVALEISSEHEQRIRFLVPHNGLVDTEQMDTESLDFTLQDGRFLHMPSSIDMENKVTIGCAGAVLTHLQRRRATVISASSDETSSYFQVRAVEMLGLRGTMFLSGRTLLALQIMESESHPSMVNQGPGKKSSSSKEGLSVYGLFQHFAYSPQGRHQLKQIFLRPSIDIDVIRERHAFIGVYLRPDNYNPLNKLTKSLKHIKNLRPVMINLRKGISTGSGKLTGFKSTVWATLLAFAFYGIDIHDALKETASGNELALLQKALRVLEDTRLYRVGRMIQEIVDIDSTEEQGRTVVKPGLDRELDKMKDSYDGLSSLLKQVAIDIASTIPESLEIDVNVIYFPQLGFNIAIPLSDRGEAAFTGSDDDWELIFVTENRAYFKDFRMREMDEKLGDIYGLICEKEIEIVYELAQKVLQYEKVLLEALLAMSQAASFYRLTRPKLVRENVVGIKGGRHILQELTVSSYVPNDTLLVGGKLGEWAPFSSSRSQTALETWGTPSMLLLTGPNYSGKSIYMKQVALIIYLAQVGSFVPAESVEMGITDKILVKSNSQDSVSQIQSTFMNDLQQISFDLNQMSERSLLIIDEFGKGTSESDGIGLICGILNHLLIAENAPKVIAATHFHEILENEFLKPGPRLLLGHMEVQVCEESCKAEDQITYLYNFHLGRSDKSYGPICAALNGINETIVERANELASLAVRGENLTSACAMLSVEEMHALEEADMLARKFLGLELSTEGGDEAVSDMLNILLGETNDGGV